MPFARLTAPASAGAVSRRWRARPIAGRLLMIGPALLLAALFTIGPVFVAVYLSLTDWNGFSQKFNMVGLDNYRDMLTEPDLLRAVGVTAIVAVVGTVLCNALGLGLALLVKERGTANNFARATFFYPQVISPLVLGFLWAAILGTKGAINSLLPEGGQVPFLSQPGWALWSLIGVIVWATFGLNVALYVAGLQTVPQDQLDAAKLDGASSLQSFRYVTVPAISGVMTLNLVLVLVFLLRIYDLVLSLTNGGPAGSTKTIAYLILNQSLRNNQLGLGSAEAVGLIAVTAVISVLVMGFRSRAGSGA